MSDKNGFSPAFDSEEAQREYDDWLWEQHLAQVQANSTTNDLGFNGMESAYKAAKSDRIDKAGEVMGGALIKSSTTWVSDGTLAMGKYISKPGIIGKSTLRTLGKAGTIYFTAKDLIGDFKDKKYLGAIVDIFSAGVGIGVGIGLATLSGMAVAAGTPVIIAGLIFGGIGIGASVGIDYISTGVKNYYYRRE